MSALSRNARQMSARSIALPSLGRIIDRISPSHGGPHVGEFCSWVFGNIKIVYLTFGRLTLGTMTLCKALGASFGGFRGSPPGWYLAENQH